MWSAAFILALLVISAFADRTEDKVSSFMKFMNRSNPNAFNSANDNNEKRFSRVNIKFDCYTRERAPGICKYIKECPFLLGNVSSIHQVYQYLSYMGYATCIAESPLIFCCPIRKIRNPAPPKPPPHTPTTPSINPGRRVKWSSFNLEDHPNRNLLPRKCGPDYIKKQIFGGNETFIGEYPWMAAIQFRRRQGPPVYPVCGGSLINDRYVLTAAHCMEVEPRSTENPVPLDRVRLGDHNLFLESDCLENGEPKMCNYPITVEVEKVIMHPKYLFGGWEAPHDIALLRLKSPVTFTEFIQPICLPFDDLSVGKSYIDETMWVAGWGRTSNLPNSPATSATLFKVDVTGVQCPSDKPGFLICAFNEDKDSCRGDSGGPLMSADVVNNVLVWHVRGVVSHGPIMCGKGTAVYTRVSHYLDWILNTIQK